MQPKKPIILTITDPFTGEIITHEWKATATEVCAIWQGVDSLIMYPVLNNMMNEIIGDRFDELKSLQEKFDQFAHSEVEVDD